MSFDQGGVTFTPAIPKSEAQAGALASLKPLSFRAEASPLQFHPLAGWATPSSHFEYIAQGISQGLGAIGQGITAAYQSGKAEKKAQEDLAREDQQLSKKYAQEEKLAKIRGQNAVSLLDERIKNVTPRRGMTPVRTLDDQSTENQADDTTSSEQIDQEMPEQTPIENPFNSINLPDQFPQQNPSERKIEINNSGPMANLTAPSPATGELRGQAAMNALASLKWSDVSAQYKSAGGTPQEFIPQTPSWLRYPQKTANIGETGKIGTEKGREALLDALGKGYSFEKGPAKQAKNPSMEAAFGEDSIYSQSDARKLRDYAVSQGKTAPALIEQKDGNYLVKWPTPEQEAMMSNRKDSDVVRMNNAMERRANDYITKNISAKKTEAGRAALAGFLAAYRTGLTSGNQNITDLDLADNYIAFARGASSPTGAGGQVTEGQYEELKKNGSLFNKLTKEVTSRTSGAFLTPDDRKTMLRTLVEAYNSQAKRENASIKNYKDAMLSDYPNIPHTKIPQEYPLLKTPEEVEKEQKQAAEEVRKIGKSLSPQERQKNKEYKDALAKLSGLSSSGELPPNAEEVNDGAYGVRAGLFGGNAPISYSYQPQ